MHARKTVRILNPSFGISYPATTIPKAYHTRRGRGSRGAAAQSLTREANGEGQAKNLAGHFAGRSPAGARVGLLGLRLIVATSGAGGHGPEIDESPVIDFDATSTSRTECGWPSWSRRGRPGSADESRGVADSVPFQHHQRFLLVERQPMRSRVNAHPLGLGVSLGLHLQPAARRPVDRVLRARSARRWRG